MQNVLRRPLSETEDGSIKNQLGLLLSYFDVFWIYKITRFLYQQYLQKKWTDYFEVLHADRYQRNKVIEIIFVQFGHTCLGFPNYQRYMSRIIKVVNFSDEFWCSETSAEYQNCLKSLRVPLQRSTFKGAF